MLEHDSYYKISTKWRYDFSLEEIDQTFFHRLVEDSMHHHREIQTSPCLPPPKPSLPKQPCHKQDPLLPRHFPIRRSKLRPKNLYPDVQPRHVQLEHHHQRLRKKPRPIRSNISLPPHDSIPRHTRQLHLPFCFDRLRPAAVPRFGQKISCRDIESWSGI